MINKYINKFYSQLKTTHKNLNLNLIYKNIYLTNILQARSISNINITKINLPDFNKYVSVENSFIYYWKDYKLNLNTQLSEHVLHYFINSFYETIIYSNKDELKSYAFILKVEYFDNTVKSISKVLVFNKNTSKEKLVDLLQMYWTLKSDYYKLKEIKNIIISYRLLLKNITESKKPNLANEITIKSSIYENKEFSFKGLNLPCTTDLNKWGIIIKQENTNSLYIQSNIKIGKQILYYNVFKYNNHNIIQVFSNNTLLISFTDFFINGNINPLTFDRIINSNIFKYNNGILKYKEINRKVQYIKPVSKTLYRTDKFITLDIETKNVNGVLHPVCISIYDGFKAKSFFISDYNSELELIKETFNYINIRKYNYQKIYVHNLSNFDGVFLLKNLSSIGNIKPLMRDGNIYDIRLEMLNKNNINKNIFYIRDSYLLLPDSLKRLSESFQIINKKTIFPIHSLSNLPLNYIGNIPSKNQFKNIEEYKKYINTHKGIWNLKFELIKYCENDVISLHQIINKFSKELFRLFRIDINKYMTLSSIAFAIYRSNFMNENNIPKINGEMFKDINKSYKGGLVDMYKPEGSNLFLYDVNSEYPEAMCQDMPGGKVKFFEGNLDLNDSKNFGFFKAEIITKNNLIIPILPVKYKNTTICPIGKWTDWYFSEELKEAQNRYGYEIIIIKGYIFERKTMFTEYVNSLYSIKENTNKDDPKYLIIKFILNMLYGRFGMKPEKEETVIVSNTESEEYLLNPYYSIIDVIDLGNGKEILKFNQYKELIDENEAELFSPNISIAIASAVVSYGRIKINRLKHLYGINVYYSDTDSIVTDKKIPGSYIGNKLGQLKLVDEIKIGYFIAPKLFGYLNVNYDNVVKNKGFKNSLLFYELSFLLYKDTVISKEHDKWYKLWSKGYIFINRELFSLVATGYKRQLIYNSYGKLVATKPFIFENGLILNDKVDFILNIAAPDFKNKLISPPIFQ